MQRQCIICMELKALWRSLFCFLSRTCPPQSTIKIVNTRILATHYISAGLKFCLGPRVGQINQQLLRIVLTTVEECRDKCLLCVLFVRALLQREETQVLSTNCNSSLHLHGGGATESGENIYFSGSSRRSKSAPNSVGNRSNTALARQPCKYRACINSVVAPFRAEAAGTHTKNSTD